MRDFIVTFSVSVSADRITTPEQILRHVEPFLLGRVQGHELYRDNVQSVIARGAFVSRVESVTPDTRR